MVSGFFLALMLFIQEEENSKVQTGLKEERVIKVKDDSQRKKSKNPRSQHGFD